MTKPIVTRIASCTQPHLTNEEINDCLEGKQQIEWVMGGVSDKKELWTCDKNRIHVLAGPLSPKQMARYLQFRKQHYVMYDKKETAGTDDRHSCASASGVYFFWCCANSEPYITVSQGRKYEEVSIDLITLDDQQNTKNITLSDEGRKKVYELLYKSSTPGKNILIGSCAPIVTFAFSHRIPKENASIVATELYRIWQECKIEKNSR